MCSGSTTKRVWGWAELEASAVFGHLHAEEVECAVRCFLAELPLFVDTPAVVGTGASVFCYHRPPEVLRRLYRQELAWRSAAG
ncbi:MULTISPECIES: tRNA-dependent cyclodipeptide synthase [unclassified Streptomyces]|uniref:tRNA-dependent cyclodipeptide synthase n=1 Tax=unclassified Streptomyces TaxID=2593676 RepID=UPI0035DD4A84